MEQGNETKEIILKGGVVVTIPKRFEYDKCKCGIKDIIWAKTKSGKSMPIRWSEIEEGWISHFVDCPLADKFRGKKRSEVK